MNNLLIAYTVFPKYKLYLNKSLPQENAWLLEATVQ